MKNEKNPSLSSMFIIGILIIFIGGIVSIYFIIKNPEYVEATRTVFELISFISSPILILITLLGLRQINVTRDIFKKQSLRESYKIATDECRKFSNEVAPHMFQIEQFIRKNKITIFQDAKVIDTKEGFRIDAKNVKKEQIKKLEKILEPLSHYINGMELFALPFVTNIADEDIGFLTLGEQFVEEVDTRIKILMPILGIKPEHHKALWTLYRSWKSRLQKIKLEEEKSKLDQQIKNIEYKTPKKAIGTE